MVAPAIIAALIGAGASIIGDKIKSGADKEMSDNNLLLERMKKAQELYSSGIPSSSTGQGSNFLQRPLFGVGGQ